MNFIFRFLLLIVIAMIIGGCASESLEPTDGWKFTLMNPPQASKANFDHSDWETVNVPHDWSILSPYDRTNPSGGQGGYLGTGIGWYRKNIEVDFDRKKQYLLMFDGAYMNNEVWINGEYVGERPYGYISFYFDITDKLKPGVNSIAVKLDNENAPNARWYAGCGLYGDVNLIVKNKVNFQQWGIFVTTPEITDERAKVAVDMEVNNGTKRNKNAVITSTILNMQGVEVASVSREAVISANEKSVVKTNLEVDKPLLWSPDSPYLYTLVSQIIAGDEVLHTEKTRFGIRSLRFDADEGFFLNGVSTKFKGVCEHSDGGLVGSAIPEKVLRRRLQILKNMGCNAIRTAHNPRRPLFYELCDEMGFMVLDEIFDGWHGKTRYGYGSQHFDEWWKIDVRDWVKRDRNHPSVVMYCLGNETGIYDEYDISGEIRKYDKTRPTTGGSLLYGVDIAGFNAPGANPGVLEKFRRLNPEKPIVFTEVPHTLQTRGFYRTLTWWRSRSHLKNYFPAYNDKQIFFDGDLRYSSSYDNCGVRISARGSWKRTSETPWIMGEFRWTGFDYLGEASFGGGRWPARIWNFGIIDLCGFPKDHYYFYQSQWTDEPMVHILPHWTHPGKEGIEIPVVAYSNCDQVELFVNGKSLGKKPQSELLEFVWKAAYQPGTLKAVGYRHNKAVAEKVFRTASNPTTIELSADNVSMKTGIEDISHMTTTIKDAAGNFVPWACNRIKYEVEGPVKLLGFDNGDPLDVTMHRQTYRKTFNGLSLGIFEGTDKSGPIEITAAGILGRTRFADSTKVAIDVERIALRGELSDADFDISYSINDSEPVKYTGPFELAKTSFVKATVFKNGKPFMKIESEFTKGPIEKVIDKRFVDKEPEIQQTYDGPTAKQLTGEWRLVDKLRPRGKKRIELEFNPDRKFIFKPNGSVYTAADGNKRLFGYWTYEYPEDPKDSSDAGEGKMFMFVTDGRYDLKLGSREANKLTMSSRFTEFVLKREDQKTD